MSSFLYKKIWHGISIHTRKCIPEKFRAETEEYSKIATKIGNAGSEQELNNILHSAYKIFNIKIPWKGDFDSFMGNKSNHLVFE